VLGLAFRVTVRVSFREVYIQKTTADDDDDDDRVDSEPRSMHYLQSHAGAPVTKKYNLVLVKGQ